MAPRVQCRPLNNKHPFKITVITSWTELLSWNDNLKSLGHDNTWSVFSEPQPVMKRSLEIILRWTVSVVEERVATTIQVSKKLYHILHYILDAWDDLLVYKLSLESRLVYRTDKYFGFIKYKRD